MNNATFNIRTRTDKESKIQHLILEGEFGVRYIDLIKSKIDSINFDSAEIIIDLRKIETFDLSAVQLIYSLKKSLSEKGKKIEIVSEMSEDINSILRNAGFNDFNKDG